MLKIRLVYIETETVRIWQRLAVAVINAIIVFAFMLYKLKSSFRIKRIFCICEKIQFVDYLCFAFIGIIFKYSFYH